MKAKKPLITMTVAPNSYKIGDMVSVNNLTFQIEEVINPTVIKIRAATTFWGAVKMWLRVKSTFPTWLLVKVLMPFLPKDHPWYGKKFSQVKWYIGATQITKSTSYVLWVSVPVMVIAAIRIWSLQ